MKNKFLIVAFFTLVSGILVKDKIHASTVDFPSYNVDIEVKKEGYFYVTENAKYSLNGEFNGIKRNIPLENINSEKCAENADLTCGGFDLLHLEYVKLDGKELKKDEYETNILSSDELGRNFEIKIRLFDEPTVVNNAIYELEIKYLILGGIRFFPENKSYFLYWNAMPNFYHSAGSVSVNLAFEEDLKVDNLNFFNPYLNTKKAIERNGKLNFTLNEKVANNPFTFSYKFAKNKINIAENRNLNILGPQFKANVEILNPQISSEKIFLTSNISSRINFLPEGNYTFFIDSNGFDSFKKEIEVGGEKDIEIALTRNTFSNVLINLGNIINLGLVGLFLVLVTKKIIKFREKSMDQKMPKTLVPRFKPAEGIRPYVAGSLIDEKVDIKDISATLVDLSYRGIIKITELQKNKNYKLELNSSGLDEIDQIEKEIISAFFEGDTVIETKNFNKDNLEKINQLKDSIYSQLVSENYFSESPEVTRKYTLAKGFGYFLLGLATLLGINILALNFFNYISFWIFPIPIMVLGLIYLVFFKFSPAKTEKGSKEYADLLGFKMYLKTAERYTLANLTPDMFKKFLSYAIVFGVERQWAKNFDFLYSKLENTESFDSISYYLFYSSFFNSTNDKVFQIAKEVGASVLGNGFTGNMSDFGGFDGGGGGGGGADGW